MVEKRWFYKVKVTKHHYLIVFVNPVKKFIAIHYFSDANYVYDTEKLIRYLKINFPTFDIQIKKMDRLDSWKKFFLNYLGQNKVTVDWFSWNSRYYDMILLSFVFSYIFKFKKIPSVLEVFELQKHVNQMETNKISKIFSFFQKENYFSYVNNEAKNLYYSALSKRNHVDVGRLNSTSLIELKKGVKVYPLNLIASYSGLDVIDAKYFDFNSVSESFDDNSIKKYLVNSVQEVMNVSKIFKEKEYYNSLKVRDVIFKEFSVLDKINQELIKKQAYPLARDVSMNDLASDLILENKSTLKDYSEINFLFPFPNGRKENLLDFMARNCEVNPIAIDFYRYFEGKKYENKLAFKSIVEKSLTEKSTFTIPYENQFGKASSGLITLSLGGSHGALSNATYGMDMKDKVNLLALARDDINKGTIFTLDIENIIKLDFESFFPNLAIILNLYNENYKRLTYNRLKIKQNLKKDISLWKGDDIEKFELQKGLKNITNSAIGSATNHSNSKKLYIPNKVLSLRIIGNLITYALGQRMTKKGGLVVSTNTDGIYVANLNYETANRVCEDFSKTYGLMIKPIKIDRFVSKNTNERLEMKNNHFISGGGTLSHALPKKPDLTKRINYPIVSGKLALKYIELNNNWLDENISKFRLREIYNQFFKKKATRQIEDWTLTIRDTLDRTFYLKNQSDNQYVTDTFRVVFVKEGNEVICYNNKNRITVEMLSKRKVYLVNSSKKLHNFDVNNLNEDVYIEIAITLLKSWHKPGHVTELEFQKSPVRDVDLTKLYQLE